MGPAPAAGRRPFDGALAWSTQRFNLAADGETQPVDGLVASGEFFTTLGVKAALGRTFTVADDVRGGGPDGPVVVISDGLWRRRFGGAPDVIGTPLVDRGRAADDRGRDAARSSSVSRPGGRSTWRCRSATEPLVRKRAADRPAELLRAVRHAAAEAGSVDRRRDRDASRHAAGDARSAPHAPSFVTGAVHPRDARRGAPTCPAPRGSGTSGRF